MPMSKKAKSPKTKSVSWLCADCGNTHGKYTVGTSTWKLKKCDGCGKKIAVTNAEAFGLDKIPA